MASGLTAPSRSDNWIYTGLRSNMQYFLAILTTWEFKVFAAVLQDFLLQNTIGFKISNKVVKGVSEIQWHWTVLFWLWESRKQLSQPMQSAQTPTGTRRRVSGLAPSQPHPEPLLLSVQSHQMTIFPSALAGELCFKNWKTGKPLFISHWSSATLEVPKYQFNRCTSHVARIKATKGRALQRLTLKHTMGNYTDIMLHNGQS